MPAGNPLVSGTVAQWTFIRPCPSNLRCSKNSDLHRLRPAGHAPIAACPSDACRESACLWHGGTMDVYTPMPQQPPLFEESFQTARPANPVYCHEEFLEKLESYKNQP